MPVPSQESERSCISNFPLFKILIFILNLFRQCGIFFPFYYKRVKQIGSTFYFRKWFFIASLKKIMTSHEYLWLSLIRITATTIPNYFRLAIIEMPFLNTFFRFWVFNTGAYPVVLYIPFHCYNSVRYITLGP